MNNQSQSKWHKFYKDRVNSDYQTYFEKRYKILLNAIIQLNPKTIIEEGIGIGSISKFLLNNTTIMCSGFDNDEFMISLCNENLNRKIVYKDNILQPNEFVITDLVVTHGVLEHFSDLQILSIFERYKNKKQDSIHYVPLDKYQHPSFGDERLLSFEYWLDLVKPTDYILFNNNHDLILIKKQ